MRAFTASLVAAIATANHNAQEMTALGVSSSGFGLDVWAVTGASTSGQDAQIDTWFFGFELTTPVGTQVKSADASAKDLAADDKDAYTYVGNDGEIYMMYAQFLDPASGNTQGYESFSCSRMLSVKTADKEVEIEDEQGYMVMQKYALTTESIGEAMIQNYLGSRNLNEYDPANVNTYENQLVAYTGRPAADNNQVSTKIWYADQTLNSTVFLQEGYKNGVRKYNCVGQRDLDNSASIWPKLEAGQTELEFIAGYKVFASASNTNPSQNIASSVQTIKVMDGAMTLAATTVVAAATLLAF